MNIFSFVRHTVVRRMRMKTAHVVPTAKRCPENLALVLMLCFLGTWSINRPANADITFTRIERSGGVSPYTPFSLTPPSINDSGVVAFGAQLSDGAGGRSGSGIFTKINGVTTTIVDSRGLLATFGNKSPNPAAVAVHRINNRGVVAFYATRDGGGSGIYTGTGENITTIADTDGPFSSFFGDPLGGDGDGAGTNGDNAFGSPSINDDGTVAFHAHRDGGGQGVYSAKGGVITTIADTDGIFSSFSTHPLNVYFTNPSINNYGVVAFKAARDENAGGGQGIYTGTGGALTKIADTDGAFSGFSDPQINDDGTVAFFATSENGERGIYTAKGGTITTIADSTGPFNQFYGCSLSNGGRVAFIGGLDNYGKIGLYTSDKNGYVKVINEGESFPGSTIGIPRLGLQAFNDSGQIVFSASNNNEGVAIFVAQLGEPEPFPVLTLNSPRVAEGNSGTTPLTFSLSLNAPSARRVTVMAQSALANSSPATPETDFLVLEPTPVVFEPGEMTRTVTVMVKGDLDDEGDEFIALQLSQPVNTTLAAPTAQGTIVNDDALALPLLSINGVAVTESDQVSVNAAFAVSLSAPSKQIVQVNFATSDDTARAPGDYVASRGILSFAPGETSKTINIQVRGDTIDEVNEQFFVKLSMASNATIFEAPGIGIISDNDSTPIISGKVKGVTEGNSGTVLMNFDLKLSNLSSRKITVRVHTVPVAFTSATSGVDYVALPDTTVSFAPGEISKTVTVAVKGDILDEENERVGLELRNSVNAAVSASGSKIVVVEGIITDDDAMPALSITDVSLSEGDQSTKTAIFTVSLSAPSGREVSVGFATVAGSALSGSDYSGQSGSLTFAPGQTRQTISIAVKGDSEVEANERFQIVLSKSFNASIARATGVGTILNDDKPASSTTVSSAGST